MLIQLAESDVQIIECFPVLAQLRPHLKVSTFLEQFKRQKQGNYQLAFVEKDDRVIAVAGFGISECLAWSRFLYVYDLVVMKRSDLKAMGSSF